MKVDLSSPQTVRKIQKLASERVNQGIESKGLMEDLQSALSGSLEGLAKGMGCDSENRSGFIDRLCKMLNSWITDLGGEPVTGEPEAECYSDTDCDELEVCNDQNLCEPVECKQDSDCNEWQNCDTEEYVCEDDPEDCRSSEKDCEDYESCNQDTGVCDLKNGKCETETDCEQWGEGDDGCLDHECVPCTEDAHCKDNYQVGGACLPDNTCVECDGEWQDCAPDGGYECESNVCSDCGGGIGDSCTDDSECCDYLYCDISGSCEEPL
jgi:hypothetical protein